jgi:hypothetical protein
VNQLQARLDDYLTRIRRVSPAVVLVRAGIFGAGLVGLVLGWPFEVVTVRALPVFVVVAALPAFAPRSFLPTAVIGLAALGWGLAVHWYGEEVTYPRLVLLATALYLVHTLSALAAVVPHDAVVAPTVLVRWLGRAALVVVLAAVLAAFALAFPALLGGRTFLVASLVGLALMAATVAYLAHLVRRR